MLSINRNHYSVLKFVSYENTEDSRTFGWTRYLSRGIEDALDRRGAVLAEVEVKTPHPRGPPKDNFKVFSLGGPAARGVFFLRGAGG